jgi:hypothetical protein
MLDCWKKTKFSTMLHEDLTDKINEIHRNCPTLNNFCSVDYEKATDLLKKDATVTMLEVLKNIPDHDIALKAILGVGKITYPLDVAPPGLVVDGQLMGHPLSFPLLCTVNLSVYRLACIRYITSSCNMWEYEQRRSIVQIMIKNVIINGDDMLFKCLDDFYPVFKQAASDAGLKLSVGKNYLSKDCCMINSQIFKLDKQKNVMVRQGYLNLKFLKEVDDSRQDDLRSDLNSNPTQVSREINRMITLCNWTECIIPCIFQCRWIDENFALHDRKHKLSPNWFLPVHLGGYGVDIKYAPKDLKITRDQRKLARAFIKDIKLQLFIKEASINSKIKNININSFPGAFLNYKVTDKFRPLNEHETEDSDPWLGRLSLIYNMANSKEVKDSFGYKAKHFNLRTVKPFTREKVMRLFEIKLISNKSCDLPSLIPITTRRPYPIFRRLLKELPHGIL